MVDPGLLSRPGSINNSFATESAASAIFLKLYAGEVAAAFDEYNVTGPLITMRNVSRQKSAQFPLLGRAAAAGLLPDASADITNIFQDSAFANRIKSAEKEIFVDGPVLAPTLITEFDELRSSYEVRSLYATELGRGVAEECDRRALIMVVLGARSASLVTATGPDNDRGGTVITDADFETNGASAIATLFEAKRQLDLKFVPKLDRHAVVSPTAYNNLAQQTDLLNRDWVRGENGDYADGTVIKVAGFQLHMSTHVPNTNLAGGIANTLNSYAGDFSTTVAALFHRSGVGGVQLRGMSLETDYFLEYQSHGMVAKKIAGYGFIRPESCVEVKTA